MEIKITKKYLVFPVNTYSSLKKLTISPEQKSESEQNSKHENEEYSLNIKLNKFSPNFYAYIDVSRYKNKTVTLSVSPQTEIAFEEADEMNIPDLYKEFYRPQIHFSTKNGWINDPNGLIYVNGKYHMFYQHNPCENGWNNMHWGHAESTDLIHWKECDIALFPDKTGMMFSGSAIVDEKNLLGLQKGNEKTVVLYYTATNPYSQYMAYSADSLKTIIKSNESPVIPNITEENRDPKVVFCDEWNAYAMVLYLERDIYGLFKSDNLINWELIQKISLPQDNECPDLFPLTADNGERKWVFTGAHGRYLVGDINQNGFFPVQEAQTLYYGKSAYAGQTFSNLPNGRIVRLDWDKWDIYTPNIYGNMSIPIEFTLDKTDNKYYLLANPVKEIQSIYDKSKTLTDISLSKNQPLNVKLSPSPYLIKIKATPTKNANLTVKFFNVEILLSEADNTIKISSNSAPVTLTGKDWDITVIADTFSTEIYLNGGRIYMSTIDAKTYCDYSLSTLKLSCDKDLFIKNLELRSLKSVW